MKRIVLLISLFVTFASWAQETIVIEDNFDDNSNGWFEGKKDTYSAELKKGKYVLKNDSEGASWFHKTLDFKPQEHNFTLEAKITQISGVEDYGYGLVWAMYSDNSDYQTMLISSNGYAQLNNYYNKEHHRYMEWTPQSSINKMKKENVFKIVKNANIVTFYVNGEKIYKSGEFSYFGSRFGFYISNKMTVEVDYFKVTKSPIKINLVPGHDKEQVNVKLSDKVNHPELSEMVPVVSADGNTLFCVRKDSPLNTGGPEDDDIWFSTKNEKGEWTALKNFGPPLNNKGHNFVISISPDNNTIITANTYNADGSSKGSGASISRKTINGWEVPKDLVIEDFRNDNDYVAFFMASDNKSLLMCVERPEGLGEKDLYVSFLKEDNSWTKPMNLGSVVNSEGDENTMFLAADNKTLYYSTDGKPGYGYEDVFVTKRLDDSWTKWSEPQNLGKSINTPSTEMGFFMSAKGDYAFVSSGGDIHRIGNPAKPEAVVLVSGTVYNNKTKKPMSADIKYYDLKEDKELGVATSDPSTGKYKIVLPAGKNYSFLANKESFYSISENVDLSDLKDYKELNKDLYLSPIEKGEVIRLNNIFFEFSKADLKEESFSELDRLVKILKDNAKLKIEIGGHTDDKGSDDYNLKLSDSRAESVMNYLTSKGINAGRLTSKGYGETNPIVANDTDENRAVNRRVEFKILED